MPASTGKILRVVSNLTFLLFGVYLFIQLVWLIFLVKRLVLSNKILRGTKRISQPTSFSVYNAKTQVVKHSYLVAILLLEILGMVSHVLFIPLFANPYFVWNLGVKELNESKINPSNDTLTCSIDPRVFAIHNHPYIFLLQAIPQILVLLLLTILSIQTFYLETRYRFSSHVRTSFKLFVVLSLQALVLTLTCSSRYTVLFEPLLFLLFFFIFFVIYLRYFHRLKLVIRGRMFEIKTFENYPQDFAHDQRAIRRLVIFTSLFCVGLAYPSIYLTVLICFYLASSEKICIVQLFFQNNDFVNYKRVDKFHLHWVTTFDPPLIILPFLLIILPHFAFAIYWLIDKIKRRPKSWIFYPGIKLTQPLI